jgi:peptide deformylase
MEIFKYGEPVLKELAEKIDNIDGTIAGLVEKMRHTLLNTQGAIGLAAPQVGESLQLSIIDLSMGENPDDFLVIINPTIKETEGKEVEEEGCLSVPGFSLPVDRATKILIHAYDLNGNEIEREIEGFEARVFQHEIDHLNGIVIVDKVSVLKRQLVKKEIKKRRKNGEW